MGQKNFMKKKKLANKLNTFFTIVLALLFVPLFAAIFYQKVQIEELLGRVQQFSQKEDEQTDRLIAITAREINAGAPMECIKAQCVIARTNLLAAEQTHTQPPEQLTLEEMQTLWGEYFSDFYEKFQLAAEETKKEALWYDDCCIYAAYHAISAGKTRTMEELYEQSDMPYLISAACYEDCQASDYLNVFYWEENEFINLCREKFSQTQIQAQTFEQLNIQILQKDSAGYVLHVQIGTDTYTGEEFRTAFLLPSANFTLTKEDNRVRIVTKGMGHGFGLSQYTARIMAENGSSYEDILKYFFPGAKLLKQE